MASVRRRTIAAVSGEWARGRNQIDSVLMTRPKFMPAPAAIGNAGGRLSVEHDRRPVVGVGHAARLRISTHIDCRVCGYDLFGSLALGRCSECGSTMDRATRRRARSRGRLSIRGR